MVEEQRHASDSQRRDALCPQASKARQIVLLLDGTGNTLTGGTADTNVLKTFEILAASEDDRQVLYYSGGVGADSRVVSSGIVGRMVGLFRRLPGLAIGDGVVKNISDAYEFLAATFREGDEIYVFGFSRGAFTALCVVDLISQFGLIRSGHTNLIERLLAVYFTRETKRTSNSRRRVADQVRRSLVGQDGRDAFVCFLGLWALCPFVWNATALSDGRSGAEGVSWQVLQA
jgi:uncharacterized protein (DUF2235 family)